MTKQNYLDLLLKIVSIKKESFNDITSNVMMKFFSKFMFAVMFGLVVMFIAIIAMLFFPDENIEVFVNRFNIVLRLSLLALIPVVIASIYHRQKNTLKIHKWFVKNYIKNWIKYCVKKKIFTKDEGKLLLEFLKEHEIKNETNDIKFSELLAHHLLEKINKDNIFNVQKLGVFRKSSDNNQNFTGDYINDFWYKKRMEVYWDSVLESNSNYDMYKAYVINIGRNLFWVYENNQLTEKLDEMKNILHNEKDDKAKVTINNLIRDLYLRNTMVEKDDIFRVKKKL